MFYCPRCQARNKWPQPQARSEGTCEICGQPEVCYSAPSSQLPDPGDAPGDRERRRARRPGQGELPEDLRERLGIILSRKVLRTAPVLAEDIDYLVRDAYERHPGIPVTATEATHERGPS